MAKNPEGREQEQLPPQIPHAKNEGLAKEEFDELNLTEEETHLIKLLDLYVDQVNYFDWENNNASKTLCIIKENFSRFWEVSKPLVKKMCDLIEQKRYEDVTHAYITGDMVDLIDSYYDKFSDDAMEYFIQHRNSLYQIAKSYENPDYEIERNQEVWFL